MPSQTSIGHSSDLSSSRPKAGPRQEYFQLQRKDEQATQRAEATMVVDKQVKDQGVIRPKGGSDAECERQLRGEKLHERLKARLQFQELLLN